MIEIAECDRHAVQREVRSKIGRERALAASPFATDDGDSWHEREDTWNRARLQAQIRSRGAHSCGKVSSREQRYFDEIISRRTHDEFRVP